MQEQEHIVPAEPVEAIKKEQEIDEESEWSLSSLQDLKGMDLNDIKEEEDRQDNMRDKQNKNGNQKLSVKYPPMQQITPECNMHEIGKITQKVGELLIVQASNCNNLVDLDNWLFTQNRECLGFVMDIFGKVDHPYYALKPAEQIQNSINDNLQGITVYYAEGCKILTEDDIQSIRQKSSQLSMDHGQQQSSSDQQADMQEQDDGEMRSHPVFMHREGNNKPKRKASYEQMQRGREDRDRTREKRPHFNQNRQPYNYQQNRQREQERQHNQQYLQNMYNSYYAQMMQLYNGGQNGMVLPRPPVFPFPPPQ